MICRNIFRVWWYYSRGLAPLTSTYPTDSLGTRRFGKDLISLWPPNISMTSMSFLTDGRPLAIVDVVPVVGDWVAEAGPGLFFKCFVNMKLQGLNENNNGPCNEKYALPASELGVTKSENPGYSRTARSARSGEDVVKYSCVERIHQSTTNKLCESDRLIKNHSDLFSFVCPFN